MQLDYDTLISANPQEREFLQKLLQMFGEETRQEIYIEESNLYFYLVLYGMLVLMIRKSDTKIVHKQYMDRYLRKKPDEIERELRDPLRPDVDIYGAPYTTRMKLFSCHPPYKLNSSKQWNKTFIKLRSFQNSYFEWNRDMITARILKLLGETDETVIARIVEWMTKKLVFLLDCYSRGVLLLYVPSVRKSPDPHIELSWDAQFASFTMFRRKYLIISFQIVQNRLDKSSTSTTPFGKLRD